MRRFTSLFAALALALTSGEAAVRAAIRLELASLRDPRRFAGWSEDDDHWKLRYRWAPATRESLQRAGLVHDPLLGWAPAGRPPPRDPDRPAVLLYGDSFIHGVEPLRKRQRIPRRVGRLLPGVQVVDLAVSGYGLDQTYLRLRTTLDGYGDTLTVVGVMTEDLDRSILTVRDAPKPRFALRGGWLVLEGVPVPRDVAAWHRRNPPAIHSFLGALLVRAVRTRPGFGRETEIPYRRDEKRALNRRVLEALAAHAAERGSPLLWVILYPEWELHYEGWRERFLRSELDRLGASYVDTKPLLLAAARRLGRPPSRFYLPPSDGHPNRHGNRVVAREIARVLADRLADAAPAPG